MWQEIRWVIITAALLAGAPVIAGDQSTSSAGATPGNATRASPSGDTTDGGAIAGARPPGGALRGRDHLAPSSLMPCEPGPPYLSLPCVPKR